VEREKERRGKRWRGKKVFWRAGCVEGERSEGARELS
jgi:hypothetical protein